MAPGAGRRTPLCLGACCGPRNALFKAASSSVVKSRDLPGSSGPSISGPTRVRRSRKIGKPTVSAMRRTWRLRPSRIVKRSKASAPLRRIILTRAGAVMRVSPSSMTPSRSFCICSGVGCPRTHASYSFSTSWLGCIMRCARSPSLVKRISPSLSKSSRPTGYTRGSLGTSPTTVGRPCGSLTVETTPTGLLSM